MRADFPLPSADPAAAGFRPEPLQRLVDEVERHVAEGRYPGGSFALARSGTLAMERHFGAARVSPERIAAGPETLWLVYSNTKVVTAATVWQLAEEGLVGLHDPVAAYLPEFAAHGKDAVTVLHLLTHQGGFPGWAAPQEIFHDHAALRRAVADIRLEWPPGSAITYHPTGAHWTLGVLIEAVTGEDFRRAIMRRVVEPLGLGDDIRIGLAPEDMERAADMHEALPDGTQRPYAFHNTEYFRAAGSPGGGGYMTARGLAAFYQMLLGGGALAGRRILSPRMVAYALRDHTGGRLDPEFGEPVHRALGPHLRGPEPTCYGLGSLATQGTFGHGGLGSSYTWADPSSGVSFCYVSNTRQDETWHAGRMERISNFVHAAIL